MKKFTTIMLLLIADAAVAQKHLNLTLKRQLDSVYTLDQKYRDSLTQIKYPAVQDPRAGHYWQMQNNIDSLNLLFIEKVFDKYGYPGKTLVDTPANESAWYIIQHSSKIHQYMPMMKKAADDKELPFKLYAMMLDRDLMNDGKEQIYGTQATYRPLKSGKAELFVWPIKDAATVNERRKNAGFDLTVEQNAKRLNITYKVVKMDEVK